MVPLKTGASIGHPAPAALKACPFLADVSGRGATVNERSGALTTWTSSMWRTSSPRWKGCTTPARSAHPKQPPKRLRWREAVRTFGHTAARNRAPRADGPSAPARRQPTAPSRHASGTLDDGWPPRIQLDNSFAVAEKQWARHCCAVSVRAVRVARCSTASSVTMRRSSSILKATRPRPGLATRHRAPTGAQRRARS